MSVQANQLADLEQYAFRAYAEALESIPLALAENSGLSAIHALAEVKVRFLELCFLLFVRNVCFSYRPSK